MQRREFLQTVGSATPAVLAAQTATVSASEPAQAAPRQSAEPRVFLYDDGRHAGPLYQFAPPLTPEDFVLTVDQLVGSGLDSLVYFAGSEGGVALYNSQVAQIWGDNVKKWTHFVWYRASRHIQQLIADGHDPLKLLCDRCHQKGLFFIASNWVNLSGGDRKTHGGQGRKSDFVYDHPQFQVGPENDPRAEHVAPTRFSFLHPEVRKERFLVFEELLSRYETDGVELNLAEYVPLCKFSQVGQLEPLVTNWLRDLRRAAQKAEQAQGRRKRIYVRIPTHPPAWKALGYDVPTWVSENLVDGLICLPGLMEPPMDQSLDISEAIKLTQGTQCKAIFGFGDLLGTQLERAATQSMFWAAAANGYHQGADGFAIVEHHFTPNGWPWTSEEYQTVRLLAQPDMLATADKTYRALFVSPVQASRTDWLPGTSRSLPQPLIMDQPVNVELRIADDLAAADDEGKIEAVQLRVRLAGFEASLNEVRIELNGRLLPDSALQLNDLTYRLLKKGAIHPYGYAFEYILTPEFYPRQGNNTVKVTLVKIDPNIELQMAVHEVDCSIAYRVHRHFERKPIDY